MAWELGPFQELRVRAWLTTCCLKVKMMGKQPPPGGGAALNSLNSHPGITNGPEDGRRRQQQHSFFSQASWGRLEMKSERNKFKVQAH